MNSIARTTLIPTDNLEMLDEAYSTAVFLEEIHCAVMDQGLSFSEEGKKGLWHVHLLLLQKMREGLKTSEGEESK